MVSHTYKGGDILNPSSCLYFDGVTSIKGGDVLDSCSPDVLVESLAEIGGKDSNYINMLQNVENKTEFKFLPDDSELQPIKDSLSRLGIVQLDFEFKEILQKRSHYQNKMFCLL